jgi:hypothetical protein
MMSIKKILLSFLAIPFLIMFSAMVGAVVFLFSGSAVLSILIAIAFFYWMVKDINLSKDKKSSNEHRGSKNNNSLSLGKSITNVSEAMNRSIRGADGFGIKLKTFSDLTNSCVQQASIQEQIDQSNSPSEKMLLEGKLARTIKDRDSIIGKKDKDKEVARQAWDRTGRQMGFGDEDKTGRFSTIVEKSDDPLKIKGDDYEILVGKYLERQGYFVFYNGIIRGELDAGVDLVAFNAVNKKALYIQCKNWQNMALEKHQLKKVLEKMKYHHVTPSTKEIRLQYEYGITKQSVFNDSIYYDVEYCLYIPKESAIESFFWEEPKIKLCLLKDIAPSFNEMKIYVLPS